MYPQKPATLFARLRIFVLSIFMWSGLLACVLVGLIFLLIWTMPALAENQKGLVLIPHAQGTTGQASTVDASDKRFILADKTHHQDSILLRISQRGNVMVVGLPFDFPPYSFLDDDGQLVGFDVDLLQAVASNWGVRVEFVPALAADALALLAGGAVDMTPMAWPAFDSQKLLRVPAHIDFSQPYLIDNLCLATLQPQDATNTAESAASASSAQGTSELIGFITGLGEEKSLIHWSTEWGVDNNVDDAALLPFRENGSVLAALQAGGIRSYLTFEDHCQYLTDNFTGAHDTVRSQVHSVWANEFAQLSATKQGSTYVRFVWGIGDSTAPTRNLINYTLQALVRSGEYQTIHDRWFSHQTMPQIDVYPGVWPETFASLIGSDLVSSNSGHDGVGTTLDGEALDSNRTSTSLDSSVANVDLSKQSASDDWRNAMFADGMTLRIGAPYDLPFFGLQSQSPLTSTELPPSSSNAEIVGFDVDLALAIAQHLLPQSTGSNQNLGEPTLTLIPVSRRAGSLLLAKGALDLLISAYAPQWPDATQVSFGEPYWREQAGLLILDSQTAENDKDAALDQNPENAELSSSSQDLPELDLFGTVAYVVDDLGAELWLDSHVQVTANTIPFQEYSAALRALQAGQVDGLAGGIALLQHLARQENDLRIVNELNLAIPYNIVVGPQNTLLRRAVDSAQIELTSDGTLASLHEKWMGNQDAMAVGPTGTQEDVTASAEVILSESFPVFSAAAEETVDSKLDIAEAKRLLVRDLVQSLMSANSNEFGLQPLAVTPESSVDLMPQSTPSITPQVILQATPSPTSLPTLTPTPTLKPPTAPTSAVGGNTQEAQAEQSAELDFDTHVVAEGDTLITLAVQYYGDQSKWLLIYEANQTLIGNDPNFVDLGSTLTIPIER